MPSQATRDGALEPDREVVAPAARRQQHDAQPDLAFAKQ
jgi:hypothetical protein